MDDKLYWMYGFWIVLSGLKSVQAVLRLVGYHRDHLPVPPERYLLTAFWTVAAVFYGYVSWRRWHRASPDTLGKVS